MKRSGLLLVAVMMAPAALSAQTPPPIRGTMATEGNMKTFYRAANTVIVTTIDGVEHVYHFTKDLIVHGGKGPGIDALAGLREGSTVVVHYTVNGQTASADEIDVIGDEGLKVTEGTVTGINQSRKQITIRFDDGKTETFRLTDHAAAEATTNKQPAGTGTRVVIYYSDEAGPKVAHYFKRTS